MKITYLGSGAWGFCLAKILAENGHDVLIYTIEKDVAEFFEKNTSHPRFPDRKVKGKMRFTLDLKEAIAHGEMVVESVTSKALRLVLGQIKDLGGLKVPFVITSKGIEQNTGLLLPEVVWDVLGESHKNLTACLTGPSLAKEVIQELPCSVVSTSHSTELMKEVQEAFTSPYFRVYPNRDIFGAAFGGAMKNIIAIAAGISDGLGYGENTKAALMTRGLHEIRKLAVAKGAEVETLNGLSGLGDLCATCISDKSRNYQFGMHLSSGLTPDQAKDKIGMVVEGAYTCVSAKQLGEKMGIPLPITEAVYKIIYENGSPEECVKSLLTRAIKEESL